MRLCGGELLIFESGIFSTNILAMKEMQSSELEAGEFIDFKNVATSEYSSFIILERVGSKIKIKDSSSKAFQSQYVDVGDQRIRPFRSHSQYKEEAYTYLTGSREFIKQLFSLVHFLICSLSKPWTSLSKQKSKVLSQSLSLLTSWLGRPTSIFCG